MPPRKGYSEQTFSKSFLLGNVFCLPDQSLFICNTHKFFTWDVKEKKLTQIKITDFDFPLEVNASYDITKVGNSNSMFLYDHTSRDPDHNDRETVTSFIFEGKNKIREMPCRLYHPILLTNNIIIGIDDDNDLVEYNPAASRTIRTISNFDKKITGFYGLKHNHFLVLDETGSLSLHVLRDNEFIKINQTEAAKRIETIQDIDDNYFACLIFDNLGDGKTKIRDCKTKLQLWKKDSLSCIQELEIKGVIIKNLKRLPDSDTYTRILIGCDRNSIFVVDFEKNKVNIINMDCRYTDFSITDNGKLVILRTDEKDINHLIQIEPDLLSELINQPGQGIIQTHIDTLKQTPPSLQPNITEEKTNGDGKDIVDSTRTIRKPAFFAFSGESAPNSVNLSNKASALPRGEPLTDDDKEERKDRGNEPSGKVSPM